MSLSNTPFYNKQIILRSLQKRYGIVRVVFLINQCCKHGCQYGRSQHHYSLWCSYSSLDDYFQESGRAGRSGNQASSLVVYWKPAQCPMKGDPKTAHEKELNAVRMYGTLYDHISAPPKLAPRGAYSGTNTSYFKS